jgi:hypothetical protein
MAMAVVPAIVSNSPPSSKQSTTKADVSLVCDIKYSGVHDFQALMDVMCVC